MANIIEVPQTTLKAKIIPVIQVVFTFIMQYYLSTCSFNFVLEQTISKFVSIIELLHLTRNFCVSFLYILLISKSQV